VLAVPVAVAAEAMTRHYLAGELSLLLGELQTVTPNQASAGEVARLRYEAETSPLTALPSVTVRALVLTDGLCWESLARADTATFDRQATVSAELHDWGVCAGMLDEE
jgi:hypothetical protein